MTRSSFWCEKDGLRKAEFMLPERLRVSMTQFRRGSLADTLGRREIQKGKGGDCCSRPSKWMVIVCCLLLCSCSSLCASFTPSPFVKRLSASSHNQQQLQEGAVVSSSLPRRRRRLDMVQTLRDADFVEELVGGIRFEMTELPDSMLDTTVYVGNLCEFVHDDDLSQLFQSVSSLHSLPACVVRKADMTSLHYGFVTFLSVEEKETAILKFHGMVWKGNKRLKVEAIKDGPGIQRVRVPERMIAYCSGEIKRLPKKKKVRNVQEGSLRRVARNEKGPVSLRHVSSPTSSGIASQAKEKSNNAFTPTFSKNSAVPAASKTPIAPRRKTKELVLNDEDRAELERALRKGWITLTAGIQPRFLLRQLQRQQKEADSADKENPTSVSSNAPWKHAPRPPAVQLVHQHWCETRGKPQIVLYKATRSNGLGDDMLVVDLSPLCGGGLSCGVSGGNTVLPYDDFLIHYRVELLTAAYQAGMKLLNSNNGDEDVYCTLLAGEGCEDEEGKTHYVITLDETTVTELSLGGSSCRPNNNDSNNNNNNIPTLVLCFTGERSKAKAMAKELAALWQIPDSEKFELLSEDSSEGMFDDHNEKWHRSSKKDRFRSHERGGASEGSPRGMKGLSPHRKRGGGHRQSWY